MCKRFQMIECCGKIFTSKHLYKPDRCFSEANIQREFESDYTKSNSYSWINQRCCDGYHLKR